VIRLGVTGTDTGVGKTLVASALVYLFRRRGLRVAAMKPVETGDGDDGVRLWHVSGASDSVDDVAPIRCPDPLAPALAARRAGQELDLARLDAALARLTHDRDAVIVEGAGGLLVPFTDTLGFDGLCRRWSLDLVIVAANRLGAINHTRLTVRAAEAAGLRVRAVILSTVNTDPPDLAQQTNLAALREFAGAPVFALPFQRSPAAAASALEPLADALLHTDAPRGTGRASGTHASFPSPDPR
jgi:dethiobiotin synthetase